MWALVAFAQVGAISVSRCGRRLFTEMWAQFVYAHVHGRRLLTQMWVQAVQCGACKAAYAYKKLQMQMKDKH